jgi:hypothetical protein
MENLYIIQIYILFIIYTIGIIYGIILVIGILVYYTNCIIYSRRTELDGIIYETEPAKKYTENFIFLLDKYLFKVYNK